MWTFIALVFLTVAFFASEGVALSIYSYFSFIASGVSFGKTLVLLFWLIGTFLIAYISVRRRWRPFNFRRLFPIFLVLVGLLILVNILVFNWMITSNTGDALAAIQKDGRPSIVGYRPQAVVTWDGSSLGHTHSLKPVIYWLFSFFTNADKMSYDTGAPLYQVYPAPELISSVVIILLAACIIVSILIMMHTINEGKAYFAWFDLLIFSLVSFSFFEATLDGGLITTPVEVGIALTSLYLISRYLRRKKEAKWIILPIFIPLLTLAAYTAFTYSVAPYEEATLSSHLVVSTLGMATACLYEFRRRGIKSLLLAVILFLLSFNLLSVRPSPGVLGESIEEGKVCIMLDVNPSTTDNAILERLASVPELENSKIIVRDERFLLAMADVTKAGVTSQDLAHQLMPGERLTYHGANLHFTFGGPQDNSSYSIYLPIGDAQLPQTWPEPVQVTSVERISSNFVKLEYTMIGPFEYRTAHACVGAALRNHGVPITYWIATSELPEWSGEESVTRFLSTLVPVTRLLSAIG